MLRTKISWIPPVPCWRIKAEMQNPYCGIQRHGVNRRGRGSILLFLPFFSVRKVFCLFTESLRSSSSTDAGRKWVALESNGLACAFYLVFDVRMRGLELWKLGLHELVVGRHLLLGGCSGGGG